jgi:hypothetical protein
VLPDLLLNLHLEAMRTGVLSRLMRMGKQAVERPELSEFYRDLLRARSMHAALDRGQRPHRAPLRTTASRI